jgi:uncharacterized HhH-GPD family protein
VARVALRDTSSIPPFDFRWPNTVEHFDRGWEAVAETPDGELSIRHALAVRIAYGRPRVRSVTWVNGQVAVEGVEADDYGSTRGLLSLIRIADKTMVRSIEDVPPDIRDLPIVGHREEIDAPFSRTGLAVKLVEDDLAGWATLAISRMRLYGRLGRAIDRSQTGEVSFRPPPVLGPAVPGEGALSFDRKRAIADALIAFAASGDQYIATGTEFTTDPEADELVRGDAFAFLIAVIFDQGIPYERAWAAPLELKRRLGHLDPTTLASDPEAVRTAVQRPPKLHRFVENVPAWVVLAARRVLDDYSGDAGEVWGDEPTARELQRRLTRFVGIGQKKAAMAVEILERDLGVPIREMEGSDIAYDIHVRRVFLRTGFADADSMEHMVEVARQVYPERPGALDDPAWRVGKTWCHPQAPECPACVLKELCARLIDRTVGLR